MILLQDNQKYIYTRKELVMMETTISNFHTSFYVTSIQKLEFRIPHVQILATNHCGYSCQSGFKRWKSVKAVLCGRGYAERLVASSAHKIQLEYYGRNISLSIQGIALEHFIALPQTEINSSTKPYPRHAVFHYFCLIIANNMLPLLLHTANVYWTVLKQKNWRQH